MDKEGRCARGSQGGRKLTSDEASFANIRCNNTPLGLLNQLNRFGKRGFYVDGLNGRGFRLDDASQISLDIHGKRSFEWRHYNEFILGDP